MKYPIRFWKDENILIFVRKNLSKKEFYETMMYIGSVTYGVPSDDEILRNWLGDVRVQHGS